MQTTVALAGYLQGAEFGQKLGRGFRQQRTGFGSALKWLIGPQRAQHLGEVGLS